MSTTNSISRQEDVYDVFSRLATSTALVPSHYSSALTSHSGIYIRPGQITRSFYYEAIVLIVYSTGNFVVRSSSILDTYGYLYNSSFNPLYPFDNLIASDDDSGGSRQFLLNVTLTYGHSYTLVVTTFPPNITGSYRIEALGPSTMYFFPYGPTTTSMSNNYLKTNDKNENVFF